MPRNRGRLKTAEDADRRTAAPTDLTRTHLHSRRVPTCIQTVITSAHSLVIASAHSLVITSAHSLVIASAVSFVIASAVSFVIASEARQSRRRRRHRPGDGIAASLRSSQWQTGHA